MNNTQNTIISMLASAFVMASPMASQAETTTQESTAEASQAEKRSENTALKARKIFIENLKILEILGTKPSMAALEAFIKNHERIEDLRDKHLIIVKTPREEANQAIINLLEENHDTIKDLLEGNAAFIKTLKQCQNYKRTEALDEVEANELSL